MRHQVNWKDRCTNRNQKELKLQGLSLFLEKPLFVIDFWWISTALKTAIFAPEGAIDSCSLIICSVTKFCHFIEILNFLSIDVLSETFMNLCNMIFEDELFCRCGWDFSTGLICLQTFCHQCSFNSFIRVKYFQRRYTL